MGGVLFSVQTLPPMSLLNSGSPHRGERLTPPEPNPPVNSDSNPGHVPEEDPEETSAQVDPEVLSLGNPGLDTNQAPSWPGLRTLLQQLPPQDSDERYCLAPGEEELAELRLFCAQRRREALGQGVARLVPPKLEECTCEKCRERLRPGEYGVFTARAGEQRCWHRACFACQACGQALINLIYFYHDGRLYCGRHHAELLRPRCPACDQLIFSRRCTEAEGRRWHENHFCCQDCAGPLGGGRYALLGGGPCCPSCFERRYSDAGSSPAPTVEGRASPGEAEIGGFEDGHRAPRNAAIISRAALLSTAASSSLETHRGMLGSSPEQECRGGDQEETPKGQEQGCPETPLDPKEDASCPTCSSSSESEPEGFFLGQRLPRPWETPGNLQAGDSDTSRKHCTIC
ncbi:prickle-like protein 4 isoform X1 [Monodon monoceros]|uniref:prickle-like protein 4 isoform X1 n=3 Tax=Monodon monoceros TaxID=40151 RepID=UPI0010F5AA0E|nr:prickle-like protein 4 isoform X1 [Monodon monoceros]XP_029099698.1 prickle-like protein 4 isoform X1 [Monodon monoceros]